MILTYDYIHNGRPVRRQFADYRQALMTIARDHESLGVKIPERLVWNNKVYEQTDLLLLVKKYGYL